MSTATPDLRVAYINTDEFAKALGVQSQTIRRGFCVNGHYLGIKPKKMPNRRLLWPVDKLQEVLSAESEA